MVRGTDLGRYRYDIDGLRCLAVLPVVFGHAGVAGFSGGFVGVDIFFVISGYLIAGILLKELALGDFSIARFYERRARRILPALFVMLAACMAVGWLALAPNLYLSLAHSSLATISFVSNIWFWHSLGDYFAPAAEFEPLLHTWSLAVEEQFYIVFPLFLWLLATRGRSANLVAMVAISLASLSLSIWATWAAPLANFFLAPTRVWELGLGALLALGAFPAVRRKVIVEAVAALGLVMIVASVVLISPSTPFPGLAALPPCLGAVAIIWAGSQRANAVDRLLSLPNFVWFGLISYSLYLWHWPVLVAARSLGGTIEIAPVWASVSILLSIALAFLSWKFVERPFRKHGGDSAMSATAVFSYTAAGVAVLVATAFSIVLTDGFEGRVEPDALATYQAAIDRTDLEKECLSRRLEEGFCVLGSEPSSTSAVEFLLWGDSHAASMLPGIDKWLATNGQVGTAAVKAGCPPLLGIIRVDLGATHACDDFNQNVIDYLEKNAHIHTVILNARWALAAEGTRAPGEGGLDAELGLSDQVKEPAESAGTDNASLTAYGLSSTIERLTAMNRRVLIVEGVPEIGFSVPEASLNAQFVGHDDTEPPTRADFDARNLRANAIIEAVAKKYGVERASIADLICAKECKIEIDGHLLYRDENHLSIYAAISIIPPIIEDFSN